MDTQQVLELLLARMETAQVKADADRVQMLERMEADRKADQERMEADRRDLKELIKMMQAYQAKTDAVLLAMQVTETSRKEAAARCKPETEVKTMACQEMEGHQEEEPTSADRKPEAAEGCERRNTAKDASGTTGHRIDAACETLEREEEPLGYSGTTNL
jgi:predicted kinase